MTNDLQAVASSSIVQPWWVKVPWQNYDEMGECPQCVSCGVSMQLNSADCEWGEDEDAIFNVCNSCAASLLPEMWQRMNKKVSDSPPLATTDTKTANGEFATPLG